MRFDQQVDTFLTFYIVLYLSHILFSPFYIVILFVYLELSLAFIHFFYQYLLTVYDCLRQAISKESLSKCTCNNHF